MYMIGVPNSGQIVGSSFTLQLLLQTHNTFFSFVSFQVPSTVVVVFKFHLHIKTGGISNIYTALPVGSEREVGRKNGKKIIKRGR